MEAAARGFNVGGNAEDFIQTVVRASMQFWEVPQNDITTFLAANPYDPSGQLENILSVRKKWVVII